MRPKIVTLTPQSDADGICASQTPAAGGAQNLTIAGALASGGEVDLNHGHLITITSAGADSGRTFTVTGEDYRGDALTEAITGPATTTVVGTKYFKKVTQVSVDADTAGAITVGVNGASTSPLYMPETYVNPMNVGLMIILSGVLTYSVEHTFDDVQVADLSTLSFLDHDDLTAKTASDDGNYAFPLRAFRLKITAFTSGTAKFSSIQAGMIS